MDEMGPKGFHGRSQCPPTGSACSPQCNSSQTPRPPKATADQTASNRHEHRGQYHRAVPSTTSMLCLLSPLKDIAYGLWRAIALRVPWRHLGRQRRSDGPQCGRGQPFLCLPDDGKDIGRELSAEAVTVSIAALASHVELWGCQGRPLGPWRRRACRVPWRSVHVPSRQGRRRGAARMGQRPVQASDQEWDLVGHRPLMK